MEKKIKILPHGPYEVSAEIPLQNAIIATSTSGTSEHWAEGKSYPKQEEPYHLCRCGHSANKPFCDGTHNEVGFEGAEVAERDPYREMDAEVYKGGSLDLLDYEGLCASMRFCDRAATVWQAAVDSAQPEMRKLAIEEACNCAAGRLVVVDKETGEALEPELEQKIGPIQDTAAEMRGPLYVQGGVQLEGADGRAYTPRNRMTLCRCGESANMPYCDISHLRCPHMEGTDE